MRPERLKEGMDLGGARRPPQVPQREAMPPTREEDRELKDELSSEDVEGEGEGEPRPGVLVPSHPPPRGDWDPLLPPVPGVRGPLPRMVDSGWSWSAGTANCCTELMVSPAAPLAPGGSARSMPILANSIDGGSDPGCSSSR